MLAASRTGECGEAPACKGGVRGGGGEGGGGYGAGEDELA